MRAKTHQEIPELEGERQSCAAKSLVKESLKGYFNEFHRTMLESHYRHYQFLTNEVALFEQRIEKAMESYADNS